MNGVIRSLVVRVGADLTKFDKSMRAMSTKMRKTGRILTSVGSSLTKTLTLPILAAGVAAFKFGKDFEKSMSKITGLVGVAKTQVDEWGKSIIDMAPKLGKAPQELADGLFYVTSAGLRGAQAMDVLTKAAKGSAAGLGSVATIADAVTSAMNAYATEGMTAAEATDILTAAVREGKLEAESLAPVLGQVLPIASAMGVGFNQVAGALAVMSRTGAEAAQSATSLTSIMMNLQKPTQEASDLLATAGLSMGDLRDMAQKQPDGLIQVMRTLNDTFGDDEEALVKIVPNVRAFKGVMNVLAQDASIVDDVMNSVTNSTGILDEAFKAASETTEFKWKAALGAAQGALISLWDTLKETIIPVLEKVTKKLQDISDDFNALSDKQKANIIKWAGLAAAIGPVMILVGKLLIFIPQLTKAFGLLTTSGGLVVMALAAVAAITLLAINRIQKLEKVVTDAAKEEVSAVETARDEKIAAYNAELDVRKATLEAENLAAQTAHDVAIAELTQYKDESISIEKDKHDRILSDAESAYNESIELIRDEYGYIESTTKNKVDISNDYYDNIKKQANEAYNEAIKLIDQELALKMALLDEETSAQVGAVQKQIDDINALTDAEEKAADERATAKELARLEDAVKRARLSKDKKAAQEKLDTFLLEQEQERILAQREAQIEALEDEIAGIKTAGEEQATELETQAEADKLRESETLKASLENIETRKSAAILAIQAERIEKEEAEASKYATEKRLLAKATLRQIDKHEGYVELLDAEVKKVGEIEAGKLATIKANNALILTEAVNLANALIRESARAAGVETTDIKLKEEGQLKDIEYKVKLGFEPSEDMTGKEKDDAIKLFTNPFESIDMSKIPKFEQGGIVGGSIGEPTLAIVHGGEQVITAGDTPSINIDATYYVSDKATAEYASDNLFDKFSNVVKNRGLGASFL